MSKRKRKRDLKAIKWQKDICKKIVQVRLQQNRSRIDVAVGADLNPNYYGRIERGITGSMGMNTLFGIKKSLEVKWSALLNPEDPLLDLLQSIEKDDENYKK